MNVFLSLLSLLSLTIVALFLLNLAPDASTIDRGQHHSVVDLSPALHEDVQHHLDAATAVDDLSGMTDEQTQEIRSLSSRDNDDLVIKPVGPTLFKADLSGVHQVVPVAALNEDGSVTITEY